MNIRRRQQDIENISSPMMIHTESNNTNVRVGGWGTRTSLVRTIGVLFSMLASFGVGCTITSSFAAAGTATGTATATAVHEHSYVDVPHAVPVTPLLSEPAMGEARQSKENDGQAALLSCLKDVLWNELPIAKNQEKCTTKDVIFAHHGDAGHWQIWNRAVGGRMKPMKAMEKGNADAEKASDSQKGSTRTRSVSTDPENDNDQHGGVRCSVWEVGANVAADDSRDLMKMYGHCSYHAFEPVPLFSEKLKQSWKDEPRMKVHEYGIGEEDSVIRVTEDALQGVSTFLADGKGGDIEIQIKTFEHALAQSDGIPTLLQINCEGCEFDFLPGAKKHGLLDKVSVIQIGWHSYGDIGLGARAWQLCEIRQMLAETHTMTWGLAFWVGKMGAY